MASYGSLDSPTYTIDITPWLPMLTDDKTHNFTLTVEGMGVSNSINNAWALSANIGIKLDPSGKRTTGRFESYQTKPFKISNPQVIPENQVQIETTGRRSLKVTSTIYTGSSSPQQVTFEQELRFTNTQIWGNSGGSEVRS